MSSTLSTHIDDLIKGQSITGLRESADRLNASLREYISVEAFISVMQNKKTAYELPEDFGAFKSEVLKNDVMSEDIDSIHKKIIAILARRKEVVTREISQELDHLKVLETICRIVDINEKQTFDKARSVLQKMERQSSESPFDIAEDTANEIYVQYKESVDNIHRKLLKRVDSALMPILQKLFGGAAVTVGDLTEDELMVLHSSQFGKIVELTLNVR